MAIVPRSHGNRATFRAKVGSGVVDLKGRTEHGELRESFHVGKKIIIINRTTT